MTPFDFSTLLENIQQLVSDFVPIVAERSDIFDIFITQDTLLFEPEARRNQWVFMFTPNLSFVVVVGHESDTCKKSLGSLDQRTLQKFVAYGVDACFG